MIIDHFRGPYAFLSNFHAVNIEFERQVYPSAEHLYQALKTQDAGYRERVRRAETPAYAKWLGHTTPNNLRRHDWRRVRLPTMIQVLELKFQHPELVQKLIETGEAIIVHGNPHHDQYWGVCDCYKHGGTGENRMGRVLTALRDRLRRK